MHQQIILHKLKIGISDLPEISLSFGLEKTGLIGKNGIGKTSIVKAIMSELKPQSGKITINSEVAYLPQDYQFDLKQSVAEALGIKDKLQAIEKIKNGSKNENLVSAVGSDWDIQDRAASLLESFGMKKVSFNKELKDLSGGERMKVILAGLLLYPDRFIIMDEPTNNLDYNSRQILYHHISKWSYGMLVISHDRELLNLMDRIVELSEKGARLFGGNFDSYEEQKILEREASVRLFTTAQQELKKIKKQAQEVRQRQEKRTSHAKKRARTQNIPKIVLNKLKRSGEETAGKLKTLHDERVTEAQIKLNQAKENIPLGNQIHVDLSQTEVPKGKLMVELKNVSFDYPDTSNLLVDVSLSITGQERMAIAGSNGSGKTTLIKLILKRLEPKEGEVRLGVEDVAYLDQEVSLLDPNRTVLENVESISGLDLDIAREWLAGFLFTGEEVFKKVNVLSGGERIRAGLAAILAGNKPVKLLVLDEPTNNLDLDSIEKIESALIGYKGNLMVVSHDKIFLDTIGIERYITLN